MNTYPHKPKTVHEVVEEYVRANQQFEIVEAELWHIKQMQDDGTIDSDEAQRLIRECLDNHLLPAGS